MIKAAAGPNGTFARGSVHDVDDKLAKVWISTGAAVPHGQYETTAAPRAVQTETRTRPLTSITGIGPVTARALQAAGISTPADLATADADAVAEIANTTADAVRSWQDQVR